MINNHDPFTLEDFKRTLADINNEAEALWYEANDQASTSPQTG